MNLFNNSEGNNMEDPIVEKAKQALIIAGGIFVAYKIVKSLGKSKKSKEEVFQVLDSNSNDPEKSRNIVVQRPKSNFGGLIDVLKIEIGAIITTILREKAMELLSQFERGRLSDKDEKDS